MGTFDTILTLLEGINQYCKLWFGGGIVWRLLRHAYLSYNIYMWQYPERKRTDKAQLCWRSKSLSITQGPSALYQLPEGDIQNDASSAWAHYSTSPIFLNHCGVLKAASPWNVWGFPALQKPLLSAQPTPVYFITYSGNRIPLGVIFSFSTGCSNPLLLLSSDHLPFCSAIFHVYFFHLKQKAFPFCTVLEQFYSIRTFIQHCKVHPEEVTVLSLRNKESFLLVLNSR